MGDSHDDSECQQYKQEAIHFDRMMMRRTDSWLEHWKINENIVNPSYKRPSTIPCIHAYFPWQSSVVEYILYVRNYTKRNTNWFTQ
jgi:hypothetical protein